MQDSSALENPIQAERRRREEAVVARPDDARAHAALGQILLFQGEYASAASHVRRAVELAPNDSLAALCLAEVLQADRHYQQAWEILKRLLEGGDRSTPVVLAYLRVCSELGRDAELLEWLGKLIDDATHTRPAPELASLLFAHSNLLDRLGRYDDAFAAAHRANQLAQTKYDRALVERMTNSTIEYFDRKTLRRLPQAAERQPIPVFIVGMARSGTSLIEQILASHPAVYGGGESDGIYRVWVSAVQRLSQPNLPLHHSLDRLTRDVANALAAQYMDPLRALAPTASHVTDKTPSNATHLGLIATLFPNARLIHSRRDPLDTGISCYLTDFAMGNAYSHDLGSIGHYQSLTERVMSHWKSVLGMPILDVDYEKMVASPEKQIRRLLEFVGLPWDQRCLRFHQNRRVVATASQSQVRRPMYDTSIGRWHHYEKWLGPLRAALD
jgi:tetratricopeptide (TPR) repeat protein